jgi:hypothetical protein
MKSKYITQIASIVGAAVVVGIVAVYKDVFRSWFAEKPKEKKA